MRTLRRLTLAAALVAAAPGAAEAGLSAGRSAAAVAAMLAGAGPVERTIGIDDLPTPVRLIAAQQARRRPLTRIVAVIGPDGVVGYRCYGPDDTGAVVRLLDVAPSKPARRLAGHGAAVLR